MSNKAVDRPHYTVNPRDYLHYFLYNQEFHSPFMDVYASLFKKGWLNSNVEKTNALLIQTKFLWNDI